MNILFIAMLFEKKVSGTKDMWKWLNGTLIDFRVCFTRKAAFEWFIVVVVCFRTSAL